MLLKTTNIWSYAFCLMENVFTMQRAYKFTSRFTVTQQSVLYICHIMLKWLFIMIYRYHSFIFIIVPYEICNIYVRNWMTESSRNILQVINQQVSDQVVIWIWIVQVVFQQDSIITYRVENMLGVYKKRACENTSTSLLSPAHHP